MAESHSISNTANQQQEAEPVEVAHTFAKRVTIATSIVLALTAMAILIWYTLYVLLLAFAGILLAVLLRAMADGVSFMTRLSKAWSLAIVGIVLIGSTGFFAWLVTPRVAEQVEELRETFPKAMEELSEYIQQFQWGQVLANQLSRMGDLGDFHESIPAVAAGATTLFTATATMIVCFVVAIFIGLFLTINPGIYVRGTVRLVPRGQRARCVEILQATESALRWWLIGRVIAMAFVGVATALGLWLLGVPLSLTLGLLAALLDFVPNIGPLFAAVPAVIIAFAESPQTALYVIILYVIVQQLESYVVTPILQQKAVSLPPAFTVFVQVLFVVLAGPLGLLLATPLAAAGLVIVRGLYVQDVLGDKEVGLAD